MAEQDYGRTKVDDHAKAGAGWVWRKVRLALWIIGVLALIVVGLIVIGTWNLAT